MLLKPLPEIYNLLAVLYNKCRSSSGRHLSLQKKIMKYLFIMVLVLSLFSCNQPSGINEVIASGDSVAINFFKGDGTADSVTNMIMLKDKTQIGKLAGFVEGGKTATSKCGYDGSLHVFKGDLVLQDIDFSFNNAQCMHFSFSLKNKLYCTTLSNEASQFIRSLNKK
jgi:hypothetical protein